MIDTGVWKRTGVSLMSKNLFALAVSFWTAAGITVSAACSLFFLEYKIDLLFILGVLAFGIVGVVVAAKSNNPVMSFVGYMLVAVPFGAMLGPLVNLYTEASVVRVFFVTTCIVVVLGTVGAIIPDNLEGLGSWLFGGLVLLLVGYFIVPIAGLFGLPIYQALTLMDWIGVVLFSGYVVYDWNRAMRVPRTLDNSIDCALSIYLDFLNIFVRLLSLTGQKK